MELFHHTSQTPTPMDAQSVQSTRKYLEGCNRLFERGLLCHTKIRDENSEVLKSIDEGYSFFSNWIESLMKKCKFILYNIIRMMVNHGRLILISDTTFNPCDTSQKLFLSWQSKLLSRQVVKSCPVYTTVQVHTV